MINNRVFNNGPFSCRKKREQLSEKQIIWRLYRLSLVHYFVQTEVNTRYFTMACKCCLTQTNECFYFHSTLLLKYIFRFWRFRLGRDYRRASNWHRADLKVTSVGLNCVIFRNKRQNAGYPFYRQLTACLISVCRIKLF